MILITFHLRQKRDAELKGFFVMRHTSIII